MVFNSITFLVFFAIVLLLHRLPLPWAWKKFNLMIGGYVFYAAWNPVFVVLLWIATLVDWFMALRIASAATPARRKACLLVSLASNLGMLGFFKYGNFLLDNCIRLLGLAGIDFHPVKFDIVLPIGISFYTFQSLSYTIDVYRGKLRPCKSLLNFAFFISFFPMLVAGPIVRAVDFLPQCEKPRQANSRQLGWGLTLITLGLLMKVLLADAVLAPMADEVYGNAANAGCGYAWLGTLAFSGQIFYDFAGYSTCAIGAALCLGFALCDNFHSPYAAIGFSDFWRRWHISLSSWLRDYLYISLGGNRKGTLRTYANLMLTMLLGGLWHGANWRFVVWGALHGAYLGIERLFRSRLEGVAVTSRWYVQLPLALLTYALVCIAWVFFRAESFADAVALCGAMLRGGRNSLEPMGTARVLKVVAICAFLLVSHWMMRHTTLEQVWDRVPNWARSLALAALLLCLAFAPGDDRAFIYFQF